ncbi:hypothetical protein SteCoe_26025 [Stentor coeruleus]|uniref:EF-hand domain-containing protein n=1 Tax=Stentor coeruleus TaxID=5963 RepID=A0A1R2BDV3_9CILI|nr:hypothetical protein SteCoe_26025 [Stentor coeruleus]
MFSYKNFIKSYLLGQKEKPPKREVHRVPYIPLHRLHTGKQIELNCIEFSDIKAQEEPLIHSPRVPQLPFLATPKKLSPRRSQSIEYEIIEEKVKTTRTTVQSKLNNYPNPIVEVISIPELKNPLCLPIKVSTLNTNYHSNQIYIMENLEKAKKYFPIPLGRKQLRTTSMSISHTPMSRLYSPQNFVKRQNYFKEPNKIQSEAERLLEKNDIEVQGKKTGKSLVTKPPKPTVHDDLYDFLMKFMNRVDMYKRKFDEIDKSGKGYLLLEDLRIYYESFSNSKTGKNQQKTTWTQMESSQDLANQAYGLLFSISSRSKISKNDFLALCAVYQHNGGELHKFRIQDKTLIIWLEKLLEELREVFELHAKNSKISKKYLQEVTEFLQTTEDVMKAESIVLTQIVDFSWFLRCIPYFLFIHLELLNKSF